MTEAGPNLIMRIVNLSMAPAALVQAPSSERIDTLAANLKTLGSTVRLGLLWALRTPKALHEIRIGKPERRGAETVERPLARQTVTRHLAQLQRIGLVRRSSSQTRGDTYVINHERVFALVDELRNLAKLRPTAIDALALGRTVDKGTLTEASLPQGPRLAVVYGRDDGVAFPLHGSLGTRWRIGRAPGCEIRLDYDPYISMENSVIVGTDAGFELVDLRSRNGTRLNWSPLPSGATRPLRPADVIGVGRSLLVFQP